jgi:hypothetical protein
MTLKYENKFKVGQRIRSYDWETIPGRKPCFVEGEIVEINPEGLPFKAYKILRDRRVFDGREVDHQIGKPVYVPMEVMFGEFTDRVSYVGEGVGIEN